MIHTYKSRLPLIAIHGGAGDLRPEDLDEKQAREYEAALQRVLSSVWPKLKEGASAGEEDLIQFCRETLAGFKSPKKVVFQELPKTSTGKIQKFALRKVAAVL